MVAKINGRCPYFSYTIFVLLYLLLLSCKLHVKENHPLSTTPENPAISEEFVTKDAIAFKKLFEEQFENRDFNSAIGNATIYIKLKPTAYRGYLLRAICYIKIKDYNSAIKDLEKVIELQPVGSYMQKFPIMEKGSHMPCDKYYVYRFWGDAYYGLGNYDLAIKYYAEAIKVDCYYSHCYAFMGLAEFKKGDFDSAIECLNEAIRVWRMPEYYVYRANAYMSKKGYKSALNDIVTFVRKNERSPGENVTLEHCEESKLILKDIANADTSKKDIVNSLLLSINETEEQIKASGVRRQQ